MKRREKKEMKRDIPLFLLLFLCYIPNKEQNNTNTQVISISISNRTANIFRADLCFHLYTPYGVVKERYDMAQPNNERDISNNNDR